MHDWAVCATPRDTVHGPPMAPAQPRTLPTRAAVCLAAIVGSWAIVSGPASAAPLDDRVVAHQSEEESQPADRGEPYFGQDRTSGKYIPDDLGDDPRPLVVLLHGYSQSTEEMVERIPVLRGAVEHRWVLVAPSGLRDSRFSPYWNATAACCDWNARGNDDVAYLRSVIERTMARYPIDRERVVVVGLSNGAFMAYQLACHASDLVVGIVAIAGVESIDPADCTPDHPVSVFHIHGTADRAVFFEGGILGVVSELYAPYPSAVETVDRWAERNDCPTPDPLPMVLDSGVAGVWVNCAQGTVVQYNWIPQPHDLTVTDDLVDSIISFIAAQERAPSPVRRRPALQ